MVIKSKLYCVDKSESSNDLKFILSDGKEIIIDVGLEYSASKLINHI